MFWGRFLRSHSSKTVFIWPSEGWKRMALIHAGRNGLWEGRVNSVFQNVCFSISLTPSQSLYPSLSLSLCIMKHLPSPLWEISETCLCMWASAILSSACRLPSSELWLKLKCMREVLIRGEVIWKVIASVRKFINKSQLGFHAWKLLW